MNILYSPDNEPEGVPVQSAASIAETPSRISSTPSDGAPDSFDETEHEESDDEHVDEMPELHSEGADNSARARRSSAPHSEDISISTSCSRSGSKPATRSFAIA
jgi:hypothetical protein